MKNLIKIIVLVFLLTCSFLLNVDAKEKISLYFFHGDGCPHCAEEEKLLKKLDKKYDIEIVKYEVWYNKNNQKLLEKVKRKMDISTNGVPVTIIGPTVFVGYQTSYEVKIERAIKYYLNNPKNYQNYVTKIKNSTFKDEKIIDYFNESDKKTDTSTTIKIPLIGKVNLKNISIVSASAVIGLVDGFNPCAMWVLLFLISMLLGMKNRKRMWALGITFLTVSALVYMMIMLSWLNIVIHVTTSILFRNIIALIAIVGAIINLNSYRKTSSSGCEVVDDNKRKKIFTKIKKFTTEKSFLLALLGVISLAISVNVIELACSAGLPIVFTQILALNNIKGISAFLYTLIYIFFFLLDDLIIFTVAMVTTKIVGISTKYNKYSYLIGGIIMLIIGILLFIKPEWIMIQFSK